jgi:hypothetical protein
VVARPAAAVTIMADDDVRLLIPAIMLEFPL